MRHTIFRAVRLGRAITVLWARGSRLPGHRGTATLAREHEHRERPQADECVDPIEQQTMFGV